MIGFALAAATASWVTRWLVAALISVAAIGSVLLTQRLLRRSSERTGRAVLSSKGQLIVVAVSVVALLVIILALPLGEATRGQLLAFLGVLFSAALALSSTTFIGNVLAGLMLHGPRKVFRPGDYLRVGEHFGRVTEIGFLRIELQTEDSDLTTFPNLLLVSQPVTVIRAEGTLVSATVSLGYDIAHATVEAALLLAAKDAGLEEPFCRITELGDFSVSYRIAGLLTKVESLLTTRSLLRHAMLDRLHEGDIEIVSPTFMNTRPIAAEQRFLPRRAAAAPQDAKLAPGSAVPEKVMFDKADKAASLEDLRSELATTIGRLEEIEQGALPPAERDALQRRRGELQALIERFQKDLGSTSPHGDPAPEGT